jgi:hypothetical protein
MENLENLENMVNVVNMIRPRWLFFVKQIEAFHPMNSTANPAASLLLVDT